MLFNTTKHVSPIEKMAYLKKKEKQYDFGV